MISNIKHGLFKYEVKDYYSILGIPIDADGNEVRARYLKIAYQLHPDTCQSSDPKYKQKASQILSKLVNPAYENLYKDKARRESQLILAEMSRKLASEPDRITLSTDIAKKLYQDTQNREKLYRESLQKIASSQYDDFTKIFTKIAILSELNMVYAVCEQESKGVVSSTGIFRSATATTTNSTSNKDNINASNPSPVDNKEKSPDSPVPKLSRLIENAKQRKQQGNIQAGILDLREALKIDPKNSTAHALIASLYLLQNNITYARISMKAAMELDPNNPTVKEIQKELEAKEIEVKGNKKASGNSQKSSSKSSTGKAKKPSGKSGKEEEQAKFFGIPLGKSKGKKEPPKIFGIPLW